MGSHRTEFVAIDTRRCEACRRCVEACREDVLGMVSLFFHKHAKVNHAERCRGCLRCVKICERRAIQPLRPVAHPEAHRGAGAGAAGKAQERPGAGPGDSTFGTP